MPIYEYECRACGHRLEKLQKISDDPLTDCPSCARSELSKLVSAAAFRLKGGGWYETDFKSGNRKNILHGADAGPSGSSDSSSDTSSTTNDNTGGAKSSDAKKSDSKSEAKSDVRSDSNSKSKKDAAASK